MAEISIPTFEQLSVMMSHLLTNYTELARVYWDMFYSTTPTTLTLKIYNEAGELIDIEVPNRALDFNFVRNGEGSPEGVVSAPIGTTYQDTLNGKFYIKEFGDGNTGWKLIGSDESIVKGNSNPEGLITGARGDIYEDRTSCSLYIKTTETSNTGWILINANTENLANRDLSNLSIEGQSIINGKEDKINKIEEITGESVEKYTSEKAVKNYVTEIAEGKANVDLDNLSNVGELRFNEKANIDLDNLSEIGESKIHPKLRNCVVKGNLKDAKLGELDLIDAVTSQNYSQNITYAQPGRYTFTLPQEGDVAVTLVGGGGGGALCWYYSLNSNVQAGGGSGAGFSGVIRLPAGTYTVVVGRGGSSNFINAALPGAASAGGETAIYSGSTLIISARGGGGGSVDPYGIYSTFAGAGGAMYTGGATIVSATLNRSGNTGTTGIGIKGNGGASVYGGYGAGVAADITNGVSGFAQLSFSGSISGSTAINYKVSPDNPLEIVKPNGQGATLYGVNSDDCSVLADGNYVKMVDETGSDLLPLNIGTNWFIQYEEPSSPINGAIWRKIGQPYGQYRYNGTTQKWEEYNKVAISTVLITSHAVSKWDNLALYYNEFNLTRNYQDRRFIAQMAMPSVKYQTFSLGASDASYAAPANGYVYWDLVSGGVSYYSIYTNKMTVGSVAQNNNQRLSMFLPVVKGEVFHTKYQTAPSSSDLRFIFAEGEFY